MSSTSFACRWALLLFPLFSAPSAVAGDGMGTTPLEERDGALAGRYSLTGDPGKKSRLRLHADGRFDLSMAGKGIRWQARGSWQREGDRVMLAIEARPESLFARGPAAPWNGEAEARMRKEEHDAEVSAMHRRCPFLGQVAERAAPVAPASGRMSPDEALEALKETIGALETAATAYVLLDDGVGRDATLAAADAHASAAMAEFRTTYEDARDAYREAGREVSSLPRPVLPAVCRMPADIPVAAPASEQRLGGYGVIVSDPEVGMRFSGVKATFLFKDGVGVETATDRDGWAGVRPRDVPLQSLVLAWCEGAGPCQSFVLAIRERGHRVFGVRMRRESLLPPLSLELAVDRDALVPQWDGIDGFQHGRYQRD